MRPFPPGWRAPSFPVAPSSAAISHLPPFPPARRTFLPSHSNRSMLRHPGSVRAACAPFSPPRPRPGHGVEPVESGRAFWGECATAFLAALRCVSTTLAVCFSALRCVSTTLAVCFSALRRVSTTLAVCFSLPFVRCRTLLRPQSNGRWRWERPQKPVVLGRLTGAVSTIQFRALPPPAACFCGLGTC